MRDIIQNILKENKGFYKTVYTIMSEDETMILEDIYETGGGFKFVPISEVNDENFHKFKFETLAAAETLLSFMPQRFNHLKPKIVKYNVGYFKSEDYTNLFDNLNESDKNKLIGSENNPKVGDFLLAKKDIFIDGKDKVTTIGNFYKIESIEDYGTKIKTIFINDFGEYHTVTPLSDFFKKYFEYIPKEYKDEIDVDTSTLFESEDDEFGWLEDLSDEPFHEILIQNDERDFGLKFNNVDRILFNPPALIGDERFNDVAFWLEDRDYYPNNLENYGVPTSFIEITKRKHVNRIRNGRYMVGPVLSDQELYKLSQENTRPDWNGNIWYEQFMREFRRSKG